jgi:hypothetical protein
MANDAATLRGYLQSALRDTTNATWSTTEMDNAIARAVRTLYPRIAVPLDPETYTQTLTSGDYYYALNAAIVELNTVYWVDTNSDERGALQPGTWEVVGDTIAGTAKIHVHPRIADFGGTLRYHGFGRYDLTTNKIPDDYVNLVIAKAEVELLHYLKNDRARFEQWLNSRQDQNVSVNELLTLINNAEQRADMLKSERQTFRKPKAGRQ